MAVLKIQIFRTRRSKDANVDNFAVLKIHMFRSWCSKDPDGYNGRFERYKQRFRMGREILERTVPKIRIFGTGNSKDANVENVKFSRSDNV